jgi:acyl dehydratase
MERLMSMPGEHSALTGPLRVGEKLAARAFRFDLADLKRYAAVSGDDNPIHLDAALARQAGLEAPPVHGMLLMSCFEPTLEAWRPNLSLLRLSAKFLRPIFAGESVKISGRVVEVGNGEAPLAMLRLLAHSERHEIVIIAEALLGKKAESEG